LLHRGNNNVKVGDAEPVKVMGAEGYPYGFNVTTEDGKPVVSFPYESRACRGSRNASGVGASKRNVGTSPRGLAVLTCHQ
jgi:hypothetical protein